MSKIIDEAVNKLCKITKKEPINWSDFDAELIGTENINIIDEAYEETILSEYLLVGDFYHRGHLMPIAIKHFLNAGYDVFANKGQNGTLALSQLCYASYDKYILEAAKVLLDVGSPIESEDEKYNPNEDDDPPGVLGSISWKVSGAWAVDKDYSWANVLETYWAIIEAYKNGKNYNSIGFYEECVGLTLTDVSFFKTEDTAFVVKKGNTYHFPESVILWFGEKPLILNRYMDIKVNLIYADEHKDYLSDITSIFSSAIGSKLNKVKYIDQSTYYLDFDNGVRIWLSNYDIGERNYVGMFEIHSEFPDVNLGKLAIKELRFRKGKSWASHVTCYEEDNIAIICDKEAYLLYSLPVNDEESVVYITSCEKEFLREYTRKLPVSGVHFNTTYRNENGVVNLCLQCNEGYLYMKSDFHYGFEVTLFKEKTEDMSYHKFYLQDAVHMDFTISEVGCNG